MTEPYQRQRYRLIDPPQGSSDEMRWKWARGEFDRVQRGIGWPRETIDIRDFSPRRNGTALDTSALQKACRALPQYGSLLICDGHYAIDGKLDIPVDNCQIVLSTGTRITQTVTNTPIFEATERDNVWIHCNGAILFGEGSYDSSWTGNSAHQDRGVQFRGCTRSGVTFPVVKNMAHAGISVIGGSAKIVCPIVEGTHTHGVAISSGNNFQMGIFIKDDATYGDLDNVQIISPDLSGATQGIVLEGRSGFAATGRQIIVVAPNIHDIPGQHGMYIQAGKVSVIGAIIDNCALSGVKIQSDDSNDLDIEDFVVSGFNITNCGSQALELAVTGTGSITGVKADGVCRNVDRGVGITGEVRDAQIDIVVEGTTQHGALIQGAGPTDIDLRVKGRNLGQHGVIVNATDSENIRIWPTIREPNTSGGAFHGVYVADGDVVLFDPDVTDADANMVNGLYVEGGTVKVRGSARFTGGGTYGARADVAVLEWPTEVEIEGATADYQNEATFRSTQPTIWPVRSTTSSNVTLWQQVLDDESAYLVRAELVGKLSGSAQRAAFVSTVLAYRDAAGNATIEGSADEDVNITSASFAGAYAWAVSGNNLQLRVNSGGTADYDWKARITLTKLAD